MLGYVLGLWFRAALVGIFIYFIYHFFKTLWKHGKKRSNKSRGALVHCPACLYVFLGARRWLCLLRHTINNRFIFRHKRE